MSDSISNQTPKDVACVTVTETVPGTTGFDLGLGAVFGMQGRAVMTPSSVGGPSESTGTENNQPNAPVPKSGEDEKVPKDDLASKTGTTKPVKLGPMEDLIYKNVLAVAKKSHIEPIVKKMETDPFSCRDQMLVTRIYNSLIPFDLSARKAIRNPDADYTTDSIIPFHIVLLVCLLVEENKMKLNGFIDLVKETKKHIKDMCVNPGATKEVTHHVFKEHAKSFHKTYHLLLQLKIDVDERIKKWILKIKKEATAYFEVLRAKVREENIRNALVLQESESDDGEGNGEKVDIDVVDDN
jgi:hypothetical protein